MEPRQKSRQRQYPSVGRPLVWLWRRLLLALDSVWLRLDLLLIQARRASPFQEGRLTPVTHIHESGVHYIGD